MSKRPKPTYAELVALLEELLEWEAHMGRWEAVCWAKAKCFQRRLFDRKE